MNDVSHLRRVQLLSDSRSFAILIIYGNTESTLELCYIPVVDFVIKSLHFFGKFMEKTTNLENNRPALCRDYIFQSILARLKAEETLGANFP